MHGANVARLAHDFELWYTGLMSRTILHSLLTLCSLTVAALATGCATPTPVEPRLAASITVTKNEPPTACTYMGYVKGDPLVGDMAEAHRDLVRNAVLGGGNYVSVDVVERNVASYAIRGRLFACPHVAPPNAQPPSPPPAAQPQPPSVEQVPNGFEAPKAPPAR